MADCHIHLIPRRTRAGNREACFAVRLRACHAHRAGSETELRNVVRRYLRAQTDCINALHGIEGVVSFFLRYVSRPCPDLHSTGTVTVALLGKVACGTEGAARARAAALSGDVLRLLASAIPGVIWEAVESKVEFSALWRPFDFDAAHVVEILRREERIGAETLRPRLGLGAENREDAPSLKRGAIYVVHQFLPRNTTLARLLRKMLLEPHPIVFQVGLVPTRLTDEEHRALDEEVARIEGALRRVPATAAAPSGVQESRGRALAKTMVELQMRLEDRPLQMQLLLASPAPIPETVANGIGGDLSYPVWNRLAPRGEDRVLQLHGGGFTVQAHESGKALKAAQGNLEELRVAPITAGHAPARLGRLRFLVDAAEAACAFRFPVATFEGLPGIEVRSARPLPLPAEQAGLALDPTTNGLIGENSHNGVTQPVFLSLRDRLNHLYIVGQTGTGKTSVMRAMILDDMRKGRGLAVLDPHGDLFGELLGLVPQERLNDVVVIDPTDRDFPIGLNLLEHQTPEERYFVVRELQDIIARIVVDQHGTGAREWMGPIFFQYLNMGMLLATSNPDDPGTLLEFREIFTSKDYWKRWLPLRSSDPQLDRWVNESMPGTDFLSRSKGEASLGEYIATKFNDFVFDPRLRNIFGQKRTTVDFQGAMDRGRIVLVNLAKGELSAASSRFLGMVLLAKFQAAAMRRTTVPVAQRRPFYLYVDEFQTMATQNFISMLSEGRKFGLGLILANQFLTQIEDTAIMRGVVGNVATHICFRTGRQDAEALEAQFLPHLDRFDLANQPNWHASVRATVGGQVVPPFTLRTLASTQPPSPQLSKKVRAASRSRYAKPRAEVESQIQKSFSAEPAKPPPEDFPLAKRRSWADEEYVKLIGLLMVDGDPNPVTVIAAADAMLDAWFELSRAGYIESTGDSSKDDPKESAKARARIKSLRATEAEKRAKLQARPESLLTLEEIVLMLKANFRARRLLQAAEHTYIVKQTTRF